MNHDKEWLNDNSHGCVDGHDGKADSHSLIEFAEEYAEHYAAQSLAKKDARIAELGDALAVSHIRSTALQKYIDNGTIDAYEACKEMQFVAHPLLTQPQGE